MDIRTHSPVFYGRGG